MNTPYILNIDTATDICSVALTRGSEVVALRENADGKSHAKTLLPFIRDILSEQQIAPDALDAVSLSTGPGSYTGLRIGTSTAKGICYAMGIPLIGIPTLQLIAAPFAERYDSLTNYVICPLLDARRMEVFTSVYTPDLQQVNPVSAVIVDENSFTEILSKKQVLFCGNGVEKCRDLLKKSPHSHFDTTPISAKNMAKIALKKFESKQFEDVAYFEPYYFKEYIAAKSHVKGLQ